MPNEVEQITHQGKPLTFIIRSTFLPDRTTFLTPPEFKQQVGYVVYPKNGNIARHIHLPLERSLVGTSEVILVKKGRCLLDVYNDDHELVATRELGPGDLMLMVGGGHGFRILEDTVLVEVKQGPYTGVQEKELFSMIPVNEPLIGERERAYISECLETGWISSEGRFIHEFEDKWAAYCGMSHGVAVSNGTVALEIAVACLDLQPGDEVILPSFTIVSCAQAVTMNGLKPVLVDSDSRTWCMDVSQVEARISPRTRAIMPVHIYGHPVDMDPLQQLARKYNLVIIEDAAEAHGAEYKGRKCGGLGDLGCFSFYANKIITTGEGGMVLARTDAQAERLRSLRNLCFRKERRFYHTSLGHNYRLTNLQAAIGLAQLERIDASVRHKRWMAAAYVEQLKDLPSLQLPVEEAWAKNVYWMFALVLDESTGMDAVEFARRLAEKGIMTRPFFLGMHEQPVFRDMGLFLDEHYPVAERIARQGLYLPSGMTLTQSQVDQVCQAVHALLA